MHSLLNTIGFSDVDGLEDEEKLIKIAMREATQKKVVKISDKRSAVELFMPVAKDTGIVVRGEYNDKGELIIDHYFPAHYGSVESMKEYLTINKRMDTDAFTIMCDDHRLGVTMIFYLQNKIDMLMKNDAANTEQKRTVYLSALAHEGKILLPALNVDVPQKVKVVDDPDDLPGDKGDDDAPFVDTQAFEEIEQYAQVKKRSEKEDVYSIVNTSFYPCGSESDNYSLVGYIKNMETLVNRFTKEELYVLLVNCNGLEFDVCINKKNLFGEPAIGRRFKGNVWMQGKVVWEEERI